MYLNGIGACRCNVRLLSKWYCREKWVQTTIYAFSRNTCIPWYCDNSSFPPLEFSLVLLTPDQERLQDGSRVTEYSILKEKRICEGFEAGWSRSQKNCRSKKCRTLSMSGHVPDVHCSITIHKWNFGSQGSTEQILFLSSGSNKFFWAHQRKIQAFEVHLASFMFKIIQIPSAP